MPRRRRLKMGVGLDRCGIGGIWIGWTGVSCAGDSGGGGIAAGGGCGADGGRGEENLFGYADCAEPGRVAGGRDDWGGGDWYAERDNFSVCGAESAGGAGV